MAARLTISQTNNPQGSTMAAPPRAEARLWHCNSCVAQVSKFSHKETRAASRCRAVDNEHYHSFGVLKDKDTMTKHTPKAGLSRQ